jgi:hypothetical protein
MEDLQTRWANVSFRRKPKVGEWVEVCSKEEILRTLDAHGQLEGMPFMPEMFVFCGRRFRIYKRAHKTCDTVFPVRGRRVSRAVHLETRCDGSAHGGCQAGCLIFWREEWLKPVSASSVLSPAMAHPAELDEAERNPESACTEADVWAGAQSAVPAGTAPTYVCQATRLPYATTDLDWWDVRQYVEDYLSGNVGLGRIVNGLIYAIYYNLSQAGIGLGRPMRWLYGRICWLWGGFWFPRASGEIAPGAPTPSISLNLQPGELVRVKSHEEILRTLTTESRNRGMSWDAEMVPYCGKTYRVLKRVTSIVDEQTGKMQALKNPCIILDTVVCQARYSGCRMFCPRSIYPYWREIWLERVGLEPVLEGDGEQIISTPLSGSAAPPVGAMQGVRR